MSRIGDSIFLEVFNETQYGDLFDNKVEIKIEILQAIVPYRQANAIPVGTMKFTLFCNQLQKLKGDILSGKDLAEQLLVI